MQKIVRLRGKFKNIELAASENYNGKSYAFADVTDKEGHKLYEGMEIFSTFAEAKDVVTRHAKKMKKHGFKTQK